MMRRLVLMLMLSFVTAVAAAESVRPFTAGSLARRFLRPGKVNLSFSFFGLLNANIARQS